MGLNVGMCFDRSLPAPFVVEVAEALEAAHVDQLWVIEDCFYTAGISLAATALARTELLTVGIGILPAVARNPAVTAMELATLANLAPGRLVAGIGHGVQEWMEQMGGRTSSPLTTLDEAITIVRRLLHGETVTFEGAEYTMRDVDASRSARVSSAVARRCARSEIVGTRRSGGRWRRSRRRCRADVRCAVDRAGGQPRSVPGVGVHGAGHR